MGPQNKIGSSLSDFQAVLPNNVQAVYQLRDSCTSLSATETPVSAETYISLTTHLSIHNLEPVLRPFLPAKLHVVWPDVWPLVEQAATPLRQHLEQTAADLPLWGQGYLAKQLLDLSSLLTAADRSQAEYAMGRAQLESLACQLGITPQPTTDAALFLALSAALDAQLPPPSAEPNQPPTCLPQLVAVYEEIDTAILVLATLDDLLTIDWPTVRAHFKQFNHLLITTLRQLNVLARSELSVAFGIGRYRLQTGQDLTSSLLVPVRTYLLNAAQTIIDIYTHSLPCGVMQSAESEYGKLIHDIQNQLLKAQFQYELLNMIFDISARAAPRLHSDRTSPFNKRIDALVSHLQEWVALYTALLNANP